MKNPWGKFDKLGGDAVGRLRGPWAMPYRVLPGTFGVMLSIEPIYGVALSAALFGRAGIVGYAPVKPWTRLRKKRTVKIGRET